MAETGSGLNVNRRLLDAIDACAEGAKRVFDRDGSGAEAREWAEAARALAATLELIDR